MGVPTYSQCLHHKLEALPESGRRIRLAVEEFLLKSTQGTKSSHVLRFRRFAEFLRLGRARWTSALDRFFSMPYGMAEETITGYRKWLVAKNWPQRYLNPWGLARLSRLLKARGVIPWELKHKRTQEHEQRWRSCPADYRIRVTEWLRMQQARNLAPSTLLVLRFNLIAFGVYLRQHRLSYRHLEYSHALAWMEQVRNSGIVATGINQRLAILKRLYNWLKARKLIEESPFDTFESVRVARRLPRILSEQEVLRLIRSAVSRRDRAVLEVLYASGCRAGEIGKIDLERVSFEDRIARTIAKGGHEQIIYLNDSSLRAIQEYLPLRKRELKKSHNTQERSLFLIQAGTRMTSYTVRSIVTRAARRAWSAKQVSPHVLRHSFATHMLNRGADLFSIMQFLGHKHIQSTVRYLQVATSRLSEVHRRFHPRT